MGGQQGQHPVFRLNLAHQEAVQIGKADKTLQMVPLRPHLCQREVYPGDHRVAQIQPHPVPLPEPPADQGQQIQLFLRQAGQKSPGDHFLKFRGHPPGQGAIEPSGPALVWGRLPRLPERRAAAGQQKRRRLYVTLHRVPNAGQKPGKGAVIPICDHHQPTFPSNRDSCCQPSRPGTACSRPARRR